ncbi:urease accessory protein UreD [Priestia abyssalis]|uniref:urease accessory protein UreD n=1 Tax=Priestia abyssalis TaxID=1221450 RepID=UPI0011163C77|nr:urease accessory protein UreD [Priestia abyssalis]
MDQIGSAARRAGSMTLTGSLSIGAKVKHGRTILHDCYYDGALKLSRPVYLEDDHPTFYLMHVGGGYVSGDLYNQLIVLEEGANLSLTTQSATKVYKTTGEPARQETEIVLKEGSFLSLIQDPLILYKHARYAQMTTVHLEKNASFLMTDILTPGWAENGQFFTYDDIRTKLKVYRNRHLVLSDHLYLKPKKQMEAVMMMGEYTHFGSLLFLHEQADANVIKQLQNIGEKYKEKARIGFSIPPVKGIVIRVLAYRTQVIEALFSECEAMIRKQVLNQPAIHYRKY